MCKSSENSVQNLQYCFNLKQIVAIIKMHKNCKCQFRSQKFAKIQSQSFSLDSYHRSRALICLYFLNWKRLWTKNSKLIMLWSLHSVHFTTRLTLVQRFKILRWGRWLDGIISSEHVQNWFRTWVLFKHDCSWFPSRLYPFQRHFLDWNCPEPDVWMKAFQLSVLK